MRGLMTAPEPGCRCWVPSESHLPPTKQVLRFQPKSRGSSSYCLSAPHIPPLHLPAFLNLRSAFLTPGSPCLVEDSSSFRDKVTVKGQQDREVGAFLTMNENNIEPLSAACGANYCFVCIIPQ